MNARPSAVLRVAAIVVIAGAFSVSMAIPAAAHGGDESTKSVELAQQAIAYLVNEPDNLMAAEEKVDDALKAPDQKGVDLVSLRAAKRAIQQGDGHRGRALLERAIGARPHMTNVEPLPIRQIPTQRATGAESGTKVVTDPLPGRDALDAGDWALLGASVLVALLGAAAAWRFRPRRVGMNTTAGGA